MKLPRFKGNMYFDKSAKQYVIRIKPTLFGRLFPKYTLIIEDDFKEQKEMTIEWF